MIPLPAGVREWLATGHTDMRKGFPSLALQVQEILHRDPLSGHLFCFRGRRGNLLKVIWHDGQGACKFIRNVTISCRILMTSRQVQPKPNKGPYGPDKHDRHSQEEGRRSAGDSRPSAQRTVQPEQNERVHVEFGCRRMEKPYRWLRWRCCCRASRLSGTRLLTRGLRARIPM
jgi:IS66 Orf2 like protein